MIKSTIILYQMENKKLNNEDELWPETHIPPFPSELVSLFADILKDKTDAEIVAAFEILNKTKGDQDHDE